MSIQQRGVRCMLAGLVPLILAACGGDGGGNDSPSTPGVTYSVGGQATGLAAGKVVVLQNRGGDDLTVSANGAFTFRTRLNANTAYTVTIKTQPAGQSCTLARASGSATANVSDIGLSCQDASAAMIKPLYLADTYRVDRASLLAQANAQGGNGYAYLFGSVEATEYINLYVKDLATTYTWEALDLPATATALQTQLNAQGARGYAHATFMTDGLVSSVFYVRDAQGLAPFSYELLPAQTSSGAFLNQANGQGARGFHFVGNFSIGGAAVAIYGKDRSSARYTYTLQAPTGEAAPESFVAQANAQGQLGYRFVGAYFFAGEQGGQAFKNIYVKDSSQAATFDYKTLGATSGSGALLTQANAEGQSGYFYAGPMIFFPYGYGQPGVARNVYAKPANCSGTVMCRPGSPL